MAKGHRTFKAAIYFSVGLLVGILTGQLPVVEAIAIIVNPMIESSIKTTSKKVADVATAKSINESKKPIPVVIDYSKNSTQSFMGFLGGFSK